MRRLSLSAKLFIAALPLLIAISALLALSVRESLRDVNEAQRGAQLGAMWDPLIHTIQSMENEQVVSEGGDPTAMAEARRATNESMVTMNTAIEALGDSQPLTLQVGQAMAALGRGREAFDNPALAEARNETAAASYDEAENDLIGLGRLLPAEAGDPQLGRELTAVAALAEVEQAGASLVETITDNLGGPVRDVDFDRAELLGSSLIESVSLFQAVAPPEWLERFRDEGFPRAINDGRRTLEELFRFDPQSDVPMVDLDVESLSTPVAGVAVFRDTLAGEIVARADESADELQRTNLVRAGITLLAIAFAGLLALLITRSITRRVRAVSNKANDVADSQLPALVEALRDPKAKGKLPDVVPLEDRGSDELGELAAAFNSMQRTLVEVASEQVEVLRRGVSDIFVTMARRNRSLVDRQLALLDELEAEVDDPDVLANYYQLDHLATRMRRNSESLLVLASAEPKRRRTKATEIDDVVRAAIGEVEDYRRIDVADLESLQVRGNVVADISHLLAELLDNAAAFSPPESRVRVSGRFAGDHYLLTIADEGVGIGHERLRELNDLLGEPPIVGLSVEPTLGMSVVSLLANKHGVNVTLSASAPGLTVEVLLPSTLYGPIDTGKPLSEPPTMTLIAPDDAIVEWSEVDATPPEGIERIDPLLGLAPPAESEESEDVAGEPLRLAPDAARIQPVEPVRDAEPSAEAHVPSSPSNEPLRLVMPPTESPTESPAAPPANGNGHHPYSEADDHGPGSGHSFEPLLGSEFSPTPPVSDSVVEGEVIDLASLAIEPEWTKRPRPEHKPEPSIVPEPVTEAELPSAGDAGVQQPAPAPAVDALHTPPAGDAPAAPLLPPPSQAPRPAGEFDRLPAPPSFAMEPTLRPVVDPDATRPLPVRKPAEHPPPPGLTDAGLPIRQRSSGPEGGPDRLGDAPLAPPGPPASLQAALSAFDAGRKGHSPALPTRQPGGSAPSDDAVRTTAPSRLDPDAIRERLRAFQQEHRMGRTPDDHDTDNGGDR